MKLLLICLFIIIFLAGCIISPPLPNFKENCQKPTVVIKQQTPNLPEPIPTTLYIDIKEGRIVKIDDGGERLIRSYALTRKLIKSLKDSK